MKEKDGYVDSEAMIFMDRLLYARFAELLEFEELESFNEFLRGSAIKAGAFALAFSSIDMKMIWVTYKIDREYSNEAMITVDLPGEIHMTDTAEKPEKLKEIPVWWKVEEQAQEQKPQLLN